MNLFAALCVFFCLFGVSCMAATKDPMDLEWNKLKSLLPMPIDPLKLNVNQTWCTCGVFLTGQFKKGESPKGYPALMHEQDSMYPCTPLGTKQCSNKCLETVSTNQNCFINLIIDCIESLDYSLRFHVFLRHFFDNTNFNSIFQIAKHLPNSPTILCGSIDRDVYRERAYLFIQNCDGTWINTNLSAGREFCCKDGSPYKCQNNLI